MIQRRSCTFSIEKNYENLETDDQKISLKKAILMLGVAAF